jgi:hypothetical protein
MTDYYEYEFADGSKLVTTKDKIKNHQIVNAETGEPYEIVNETKTNKPKNNYDKIKVTG